MSARPGVVSQPDTEVLDLHGLPLLDLLHGDDLSGRLLELPQLSQEVPETRLGHNHIRGKNPHSGRKNNLFSKTYFQIITTCKEEFLAHSRLAIYDQLREILSKFPLLSFLV